MGLFSFIGKVGQAFTKSPKYNVPDYQQFAGYQPSQYEKPAAAQLYKTYSRRAAGKDVGFETGDIRTMRAQAIDEAQRVGGELERRGMAGRRMTGGVTTGGMARLREKGILSTQLARSDALRDIAIRNAVLKRTETWEGVLGLDKFLQSERSDAYQRTAFSRQRTEYGNVLSEKRSQGDFFNARNQYQKSLEKWGLFGDFESAAEGAIDVGTGGYDYSQAFPKSLSRYR